MWGALLKEVFLTVFEIVFILVRFGAEMATSSMALVHVHASTAMVSLQETAGVNVMFQMRTVILLGMLLALFCDLPCSKVAALLHREDHG